MSKDQLQILADRLGFKLPETVPAWMAANIQQAAAAMLKNADDGPEVLAEAAAAGDPDLAAAYEWALKHPEAIARSNFLNDLTAKLRGGRKFSQKQRDCYVEGIAKWKANEEAFRKRQKANREAFKTEVEDALPSGRQTLTGRFMKASFRDTQFGRLFKGTFKTQEGWRIYLTIPRSIRDAAIDAAVSGRGGAHDWDACAVHGITRMSVTLTVTVEPKERDFGFGRRPALVAAVPDDDDGLVAQNQ